MTNHPQARSKSGFTLIEMVIVVTIISVLASIAIPNYQAVRTKAEAARIATQLHYLEDAIIEALLDGATMADLATIDAANISGSVLGDYLTAANLTDVPDGFSFDISSQLDSLGGAGFVVFVMLTASGDSGTRNFGGTRGHVPTSFVW